VSKLFRSRSRENAQLKTFAIKEEEVGYPDALSARLGIPLLIQEGWLRHQEKDAKPPQRRRRGGPDCRSVSECIFGRGSILDNPVRSVKGGFATSS